MKILKGSPISSGITKGVICMYLGNAEADIPHYEIGAKDIPLEIKRFHRALESAKNEMNELIRVSKKLGDKNAVDIFTAHLLMLKDQGMKEKVEGWIAERMINAEHVVSHVFGDYIKKYESESGHFKELAHDFVDMRDRLLAAFKIKARGFKCSIGEVRPVIVAAKALTPSMVLNLKKSQVLGFVVEEGGITSHATILARAFNVPMVFGIKVGEELDCGCRIYLDGSEGKVVLDADKKTAEYYEKKIEKQEEKRNICESKKRVSARTKIGQRITLKVNISTPDELHLLNDVPYDGVGLLRTEFLFTKRDTEPTEEEQYKMYSKLLADAAGKPVTVRLLDISSDKLPPFLKIPEHLNPDLDFRGAMAAEIYEDLYIKQIKALLRANGAGKLKLLYPMVSDLGDLETFRKIVFKAKAELRKEKMSINTSRIPEGCMIETPGAVMLVEELLSELDFINIGTNDLLQYTLAAARGNELAERRYHILHPSVLKFIEIIAKASKKAGKDACLCGEVAGFEEFYPLLLGAGLTSFSLSATKFQDIKCELMHLAHSNDKSIVSKFYATRSKEEAEEYISRFL